NLDSHFRGDDGGEGGVFPINARNLKSRHSRKNKKSKTEISSFPRRRESRNSKLQEFIRNG
ncbi:hypothetical protein, partial [Neisseria meningitidis]|uniref:hypothetical protein n=1 Tax=Neisseria meningitidis TaxID=487 RepID=UPI001E42130B